MRDLKSELEVKEAKHFKRKAGDVFEGECSSYLCRPQPDDVHVGVLHIRCTWVGKCRGKHDVSDEAGPLMFSRLLHRGAAEGPSVAGGRAGRRGRQSRQDAGA